MRGVHHAQHTVYVPAPDGLVLGDQRAPARRPCPHYHFHDDHHHRLRLCGGHGGAVPITTTTTDTNITAPAAQGSQGCPAPQQSQGYPAARPQTAAPAAQSQPAPAGVPAVHNEFQGSSGTLDLETHQPIEVIESPTSTSEAFLGSMKSMLLRNRGSFVTATFLIGTQGTTTWEGILHDAGNDHIIIFQPGRQRYIACDIYALKYIEFYDTRERDACAQLLRQSGLNSDMNRGINNFY